MRIHVTNQARWRRTKVVTTILLFVIALACSGGLESQDPSAPMPDVAGFVTAISLFAYLFINIIRTGE